MELDETPQQTLNRARDLILRGKVLVTSLKEHYEARGLTSEQAIARLASGLSAQELQTVNDRVAADHEETQQAIATKSAQFKADKKFTGNPRQNKKMRTFV